jgi:hypothetical protein
MWHVHAYKEIVKLYFTGYEIIDFSDDLIFFDT